MRLTILIDDESGYHRLYYAFIIFLDAFDDFMDDIEELFYEGLLFVAFYCDHCYLGSSWTFITLYLLDLFLKFLDDASILYFSFDESLFDDAYIFFESYAFIAPILYF